MPSSHRARDERAVELGRSRGATGLPWREALAGVLQGAATRILRPLCHSRNRLTEEEVASRVQRLPYNPAKARKHVDCFGRYMSFAGKRVLDVGCGYGDVAIGLVKAGARCVVGVDLNPLRIECAQRNAAAEGVGHAIRFVCVDFVRDYLPLEPFDCALSIGSFEHILDAKRCLEKIHDSVVPGGSLLTRFGPLWLSPYGGHMFDFTRVPWVHLLFPESVVLKVRRECFRPGQDAKAYEDIVGHLNRITTAKFRAYATQAGFVIRYWRLNPEKDQKWGGVFRPFNSALNATPVLRELGALTLLAVLDKLPGAGRAPVATMDS